MPRVGFMSDPARIDEAVKLYRNFPNFLTASKILNFQHIVFYACFVDTAE